MALQPTSIEIGTTPETGVFFYEALEQLDPYVLELVGKYSQIVVESDAVRGLIDTNPHFHEENAGVDDTVIIDRYMSDAKKAMEDGGAKDARLHQEMAWRHRLREESARAIDTGDAIRRGVFSGSPPRLFGGSEPAPTTGPSVLLPRLIEMLAGTAQEIGTGRYSTVTLTTLNGKQREFVVRADGDQLVMFGTSVIISRTELAGIREASADDCCQLVNDLASTRTEVL